MAAEPEPDSIVELVRSLRERVSARYPGGGAGPQRIPLANLMPMVHARDAAEAKVASIGSVNPRRGGPVNWALQTLKKLVSRALDWHVREQVLFNRNLVECINANIEAMNEINRALVEIGSQESELRSGLERQHEEVRGASLRMDDIVAHWNGWRAGWEDKLAKNEIQFLRSVADLQAGYLHRSTLMEGNFRDLARAQHIEFSASMEKQLRTLQDQMWRDFGKIKLEFEALIYAELRVARQRALVQTPQATPAAAAPDAELAFDYGRFAERFRGPEEYVRKSQEFYAPYFADCTAVLDIGCGRGEFLELLREKGIPGGGIDLSEESVAACLAKGLEAEKADLFEFLDALPPGALDGIFSAQVVEHLPPGRLPEMIKLCGAKIRKGGVIAIETPNPECLAIFATHFYLDPTHTRPVPPQLLAFYLEEFGFGQIEVKRLSPAVESVAGLQDVPAGFRQQFFDGLDYALIARKLV